MEILFGYPISIYFRRIHGYANRMLYHIFFILSDSQALLNRAWDAIQPPFLMHQFYHFSSEDNQY